MQEKDWKQIAEGAIQDDRMLDSDVLKRNPEGEITKELLDSAIAQRHLADTIIKAYYEQERKTLAERFKNGPSFTADELRFSATARCSCGAGLAYPKCSGIDGCWDCSEVLMGTADITLIHSGRMPFSMYNIKAESDHNGTTRPCTEKKDG